MIPSIEQVSKDMRPSVIPRSYAVFSVAEGCCAFEHEPGSSKIPRALNPHSIKNTIGVPACVLDLLTSLSANGEM